MEDIWVPRVPRDWLRHQPSLLQVQIPHRRAPRCQSAQRAGNSMNLPECNHESMINYLDRACSRSGGWIIVPAPSLQIFSLMASLFSLPIEAKDPPLHCRLLFALLFLVGQQVHICSKHLTAALPSSILMSCNLYSTNRWIAVSQDRIGSGGRCEPRGTRSSLLAQIDVSNFDAFWKIAYYVFPLNLGSSFRLWDILQFVLNISSSVFALDICMPTYISEISCSIISYFPQGPNFMLWYFFFAVVC